MNILYETHYKYQCRRIIIIILIIDCRLVDSAHEDIFARGSALQILITEKMTVDMRKYTERFTRCNPDKKSVSQNDF